jgi:hypothetical protein
MAENHRSAMGKSIDMASLRAQNEKTRAIGNMRVNSRGDTIDSNGNVIQDNNKRVNEYYMKAVMNRAARGELPVLSGRSTQPAVTPTPAPTQPAVQVQQPNVPKVDVHSEDLPLTQLTEEERLFEQEDTDFEIPSKSKKSNSSK